MSYRLENTMKIEENVYIEDSYTLQCSDADFHCQGDSSLYDPHPVVVSDFFWLF